MGYYKCKKLSNKNMFCSVFINIEYYSNKGLNVCLREVLLLISVLGCHICRSPLYLYPDLKLVLLPKQLELQQKSMSIEITLLD